MNKIYRLKHIETPRLIIRPVELGDEIAVNQAINNSLDSLQQWMPWAQDPSLESTRNFIQKGVFAQSSQTIADFPMVVIHKADNKIISASGYNERSDLNIGLYEIGYWCDSDYQGKGYVTEFVNALTQYALKALKAKIIIIRMDVNNIKSLAVAKRLNFENQGIKPSATQSNATDYYFTCTHTDRLPPLDISWHHEETNHDEAKIISWAKSILNITNDKAFALSKAIVKTPWSRVFEIQTGESLVYLKQTPKLFFLEPKVIQLLNERFNAPVPTVIAESSHLSCFLMQYAGSNLRERLKNQFEEKLVFKTIEQFTTLQSKAAEQITCLLDADVPDYRLKQLPNLYLNLIKNNELLTNEGLSETEMESLVNSSDAVVRLCDELARYNIKQTIVQPDFSDNNTLIDESKQTITIIDLGEIVISHPFFSLLNFLKQMKKHYGVNEKDRFYQKFKDACFNGYMHCFSTHKEFQDALIIAEIANGLFSLVYQERFIAACGKENLIKYGHWKLGTLLKAFHSDILRFSDLSTH